MPGYMSAADFAELEPIVREGYETLRNFTQVAITLRRRGDHETGGWVTTGQYDLIRISLTNRDPEESGANRGAVETSTVGEFQMFAPIDCQKDDRFTWADRTCVVDQVQPERYGGVVTVRFHLLEGGA